MSIFRISLATLCSLYLLGLSGCETTTSGGVVGAQRSQLLLISSQQLDQMAAQSYEKLKAEAASKGVLNRDRAMLQRVRGIVNRLVPQTAVFRNDAPGWSMARSRFNTPLLAASAFNFS